MTLDLEVSRDDLAGKPNLSLFLCSSLFHFRPELTGPPTPKPAVAESNTLKGLLFEGCHLSADGAGW